MKPKRSRSVNWDDEEKQLLCSVLKDYANIIEDKSLTTNTNKNKTKAWEEVHKKFNGLNRRQRELNQLKIQWKGMKVNARKKYSEYKQEAIKTGGGARPATPDDSVIEIIDLLNPAELLRDDNPLDSDGLVLNTSAINEVLPSASGACAKISLPIPSDGETSDNTLEDTNSDHETMENDGTQALLKLEQQDSSSGDACETMAENIPCKNVSTKIKLYYLDSETNNLKMVSDVSEAISNRAKNVKKPYENFKTLPEHPNATTAPPNGALAESDEYTTFGNHVANQLRKLSSVHYVLAQEEIQSVLTKFRMLDLNE